MYAKYFYRIKETKKIVCFFWAKLVLNRIKASENSQKTNLQDLKINLQYQKDYKINILWRHIYMSKKLNNNKAPFEADTQTWFRLKNMRPWRNGMTVNFLIFFSFWNVWLINLFAPLLVQSLFRSRQSQKISVLFTFKLRLIQTDDYVNSFQLSTRKQETSYLFDYLSIRRPLTLK